jgi:hypothetical protein
VSRQCVAVRPDPDFHYDMDRLISQLTRLLTSGETEENRNAERLMRARDHIETRLKKRGGHRASFEAIRNEVNESYSDDFICELIELNPKIFGRCIIKRGNKPGITLVNTKQKSY